jgi:chromosome segregation ATPase
MTDKSELITILPGSKSKLMIASKNLISAAIKLGTPSEIGVILGGGYEFDVAKSVTAAIPYLYNSIEEAESKLLDPSIDYQSKVETQKNTLQLQEEVKSKNAVIEQLESQVADLRAKLESSVDSAKCNELETQVAELETSNRELTGDKSRLMTQVQELQDQLNAQNNLVNKLREDSGKKDQDLSTNNELISKLNDQINDLQKKLDHYENQEAPLPVTSTQEYLELKENLELANSKIQELKDEKLKATSELESSNKDLRENLSEAVDKIEKMKSTFNAACEKFNLYLDDNGEWQQESTKAE